MKLTETNYFSPEAESIYMGSTQYKRFRACESQALAIISGRFVPETSTAMLVGSYVDSYFSGTQEIFKLEYPELFTRGGELKSEYIHANYIIRRIERDEQFLQALSGKTQVILTGEIEGVPVKVKIDSLLPDRTVDLKVMKDFDNIYNPSYSAWEPFWQAWGYDIQGALYQEIRRQNDGQRVPFGIAGATKEKPEPDIALFELPQSSLDVALDEIRANIAYYNGLKKGLFGPVGCGDCAWCRSQKKLKGWVTL